MTVTVTVPSMVKVQDRVEVPGAPVAVGGVSVHAELSLVNATSPINPFDGETVIVEVPATPTLVVTNTGFAKIEKSGRLDTVAEPVRHWLGVAPQSTRVKPEGSVTEDGSLGLFAYVMSVVGPDTTL